MTMDKKLASISELTLKAIEESGKTIADYTKESIMNYLKSNGVKDKSDRNMIYETLASNFNRKKKSIVAKIDSGAPHNEEVPKKQPRKNIFSKIEKLTK